MKLIIDIPEVDYNYAKQQVADGITNPLKIFIASGTPIPDNATVCDIEQIRAEIIKQFEGCYLEEDMTDERKAEHKAYENVLQIIDKYTKQGGIREHER